MSIGGWQRLLAGLEEESSLGAAQTPLSAGEHGEQRLVPPLRKRNYFIKYTASCCFMPWCRIERSTHGGGRLLVAHFTLMIVLRRQAEECSISCFRYERN
jgi:hypothetical protein